MTPASASTALATLPHHGLADVVQRLSASVVGIAMRRASASGLVWRPGVVVSSALALARAHRLHIVLPDGETVPATLRGIDPGTDIAALSFEDPGLPTAERAAGAAPRVGDFVMAVGREPSGQVQASFGHVGAAAGEWRGWRGSRIERLIRLDGGLYPGLAGAPVAGIDGLVLGIASPAFSRLHGVVLPVATIERVVDALLTHGRVQQGYIGIAAQTVRVQVGEAPTEGLLISSVAEDGPAARAGLLVGDVIVAAAGQSVSRIDTLRELLGAEQVGGRLRLQVARGGQPLELSLEVAERPTPAPAPHSRWGCH